MGKGGDIGAGDMETIGVNCLGNIGLTVNDQFRLIALCQLSQARGQCQQAGGRELFFPNQQGIYTTLQGRFDGLKKRIPRQAGAIGNQEQLRRRIQKRLSTQLGGEMRL